MFVYVPWRAPKPAAKVRSDAPAAGDSNRHEFGEVEKRGSICSIKECGNRNARMGCKTCNVYLCSPECITAHLFDTVTMTNL